MIPRRRLVTRVYCKKNEMMDDMNYKKKENLNKTVETLRKNAIQDLEYLKVFEKRKIGRINEILKELKGQSEKDMEYVKDLYNTVKNHKSSVSVVYPEVDTDDMDDDDTDDNSHYDDLYFESSDEL